MYKGQISKTNDQDFLEILNKQYPDEFSNLKENLKRLTPMLKAVYDMCQTEGWKVYIKPFLERQGDPRVLFTCIGDAKKFEQEAPRVLAFNQILNYINSIEKTANSVIFQSDQN